MRFTGQKQEEPGSFIQHFLYAAPRIMAPVIIVEMYAKDTPAAIEGLKRTLNEAAKHYKNSQGTIEWLPIQDTEDERAFTVFEKFESEKVSNDVIALEH